MHLLLVCKVIRRFGIMLTCCRQTLPSARAPNAYQYDQQPISNYTPQS